MPFLRLPAFYESFLYLVLHWIVLATSWNILSGYSGYFSFGHGAFYGAGVYTTAVLAGKFDVPFLWTLPAAALVAALLGVALGAVVFRVRSVRGELFALLTLAVTFVLATIVLNTPIDGGPGVYLSGVAVPALAPTPSGTFYMLALALAIATLAIAYAIAQCAARPRALRDPRRRGRRRGDGRADVSLQARRVRHFVRARGHRRRHPRRCSSSYVTANGTFNITVPLTVDPDERARRHAALGGPRARRHGDHDPALRVDGGRAGVAGKASDRRDPGRRRAVHAERHARAGVRTAAAADSRTAPLRADARRRRRHAASHATGGGNARPRASPGATLLAVRGLRKSFKGVHALDGVDLDVREGEILGVLGPNGSGKSTLINVVSGHYRADAGSVTLRGRRDRRAGPRTGSRAPALRAPTRFRGRSRTSPCATTSRSPRCSAPRRSIARRRRRSARCAGCASPGSPTRERRASGRAQPAPDEVPRARARARGAAATAAARRGAVGPHAGRDRRGRRSDSPHPRSGHDDRAGRARDARRHRAVGPHRRARPGSRAGGRQRGRRDGARRRRDRLSRGSRMLEVRDLASTTARRRRCGTYRSRSPPASSSASSAPTVPARRR